jgi:hypothetical protein
MVLLVFVLCTDISLIARTQHLKYMMDEVNVFAFVHTSIRYVDNIDFSLIFLSLTL